jgi:hypothetical protein
MARKRNTITLTTDAGYKIIKLYEMMDKLRERFVFKDGALAFMYNKNQDADNEVLDKLSKMAEIEGFCIDRVLYYDTVEEQEKDNQGLFFRSLRNEPKKPI